MSLNDCRNLRPIFQDEIWVQEDIDYIIVWRENIEQQQGLSIVNSHILFIMNMKSHAIPGHQNFETIRGGRRINKIPLP